MPSAILIPAGTVFGKLTTTGAFERRHGVFCWECICVCGRRTSVVGNNLRKGFTQACGCGRAANRLRHGHARRSNPTLTWIRWKGMNGRCADPSSPWYGARGIRVCDAWKDFMVFERDMGPCPSAQYSLDRIDPDGHYEPGNVRWATTKEQSRNTRLTVRVEWNGRLISLRDACDEVNLPHSAVTQRIKQLGWSVERALTQPVRVTRRA